MSIKIYNSKVILVVRVEKEEQEMRDEKGRCKGQGGMKIRYVNILIKLGGFIQGKISMKNYHDYLGIITQNLF